MSLKRLVRQAAYWTVPPGFERLGREFIYGLRSRDRAVRSILARNAVWHNYHAGDRRCFILASGPSIRQQDMTLLRNEICISVSNWYVHKDYALIQPRYHCVPDIGGHPQITEPDAVRWFRQMEERTGRAVVFLSYNEREMIERNRLFTNREVYYLHFAGSWSDFERSGVDPTRSVPAVQSVSVMALQIALFMGFKEIYLLGCDHAWIQHYGISAHFYAENKHSITSRPDYPGEWGGVEFELRCCLNLWQQYKMLKKLAEIKGVVVYNATAGGLLDVFERVEYERLFE